MNTMSVIALFGLFGLGVSIYLFYRLLCLMDDVRYLADRTRGNRSGASRLPQSFIIISGIAIALLILLFFAVRADFGGSLAFLSLLGPSSVTGTGLFA